MNRQELANRVIGGGWDDHFVCADGLRIDMACANVLSLYPTHALGMVRTHLSCGSNHRRRLANMLTGEMPELEVAADIGRRCVKPPFPGKG